MIKYITSGFILFSLGVYVGLLIAPRSTNESAMSTSTLPAKGDASHTHSAPTESAKTNEVLSEKSEPEDLNPTAFLAETNPGLRHQNLFRWLAQISKDDSLLIKRTLDRLPLAHHKLEHELILQSWASIDPSTAAEYALNHYDYVNEGWGFAMIAELWGQQDPDAALQWIKAIQHKIPEQNGAYIADWLIGVGRNNFADAESWFFNANEDGYRLTYLESLMKVAAEQKDFDIEDWTQAVPKTIGTEATRIFIENLAIKEPPQASQLLAKAERFEFDDRLTSTLIGSLKEEGIESAATWTLTVKNPVTRANAFSSLTKHWVAEDLATAGEWLNLNASGPEFGQALRIYSEAASRVDPIAALDWAQSIEDSNQRIASVMTVVRNWQHSDHESALNWVAQSDLPEFAKQEFQ